MNASAVNTYSTILAAARTLFLERNYKTVTMDQLGAQAGVTKGALYHHFVNKEQLYLEMMHADLSAKRALFREGVKLDGTCRERLRHLTKAFFGLPREQQRLIHLVRRDVNVFHDPARAELVQAYQSALPNQIQSILEDGIRAGELYCWGQNALYRDSSTVDYHILGLGNSYDGTPIVAVPTRVGTQLASEKEAFNCLLTMLTTTFQAI